MSRKLLILNGLAILTIPIHHASAYGLQAMFFWTDRYLPVSVPNYDQMGSLAYYFIVIMRQLDTFSVPAFLFISGFFVSFMARGKESKVTLNMLLPRIKILLIPFFIWTVIRFVLLRHFPKSLDEILDPYHFIPLLIQFYFLSPLLVPLARNHWKLFLFAAAVIHLSIQGLNYITSVGIQVPAQNILLNLTPRWLIIGQQPFWFPFGLAFGLHLKYFNERLDSLRNKLPFFTILFAVLAIAEYFLADYLNGETWIGPTFSGFTRNLFILSFILLVLTAKESSIPFYEKFSDLGSRSLGIYLANIPFIFVTAVMMYYLTPWALGMQFIYQAVLVAVGLGGPLFLMWLVRETPIRVSYRFLFG